MPLIDLGTLLVLIFILMVMFYCTNSISAKVKLALKELEKINENITRIKEIEEERDWEESEKSRN